MKYEKLARQHNIVGPKQSNHKISGRQHRQPLLRHQDMMGNRRAQRLLPPQDALGTAPTGERGDVWERQADQLAAQVGHERTGQWSHNMATTTGHWQDWEKNIRPGIEAILGEDLQQVRLHTDAAAAAEARSRQAKAFTVAEDIFFAAGNYDPRSGEGLQLLAHELAHVVQQRHYPSQTPALQLMPDDPQQNLALDVLGWVVDLVRVLGWAVLAGGEERGRASLHLLHNMFGAGEPLTVPKEWVMAAPSWQEGYNLLLAGWLEKVIIEALIRDYQGSEEGCESSQETVELQALPWESCIFPWCSEADQFWGSGWARFTVSGSYCWRVDNANPIFLEIFIFNIRGSYRDYYVWEHAWDADQHSRQERGWYTPFALSCDWEEEDRLESRARTGGLYLYLREERERQSR